MKYDGKGLEQYTTIVRIFSYDENDRRVQWKGKTEDCLGRKLNKASSFLFPRPKIHSIITAKHPSSLCHCSRSRGIMTFENILWEGGPRDFRLTPTVTQPRSQPQILLVVLLLYTSIWRLNEHGCSPAHMWRRRKSRKETSKTKFATVPWRVHLSCEACFGEGREKPLTLRWTRKCPTHLVCTKMSLKSTITSCSKLRRSNLLPKPPHQAGSSLDFNWSSFKTCVWFVGAWKTPGDPAHIAAGLQIAWQMVKCVQKQSIALSFFYSAKRDFTESYIVIEHFSDHLPSVIALISLSKLERGTTVKHVSLHDLFRFSRAHSMAKKHSSLRKQAISGLSITTEDQK